MADPHIAPAASAAIERWQHLVRTALGGRDPSSLRHRTRDGIVVEPLYPARRDVGPLSGRGAAGWGVLELVDDPDPLAANKQALEALEGGAAGLQLRFASSPLSVGRGLPAEPDALSIAVDGIDLGAVHLRLDPHGGAPDTARRLAELVGRQGVAPELARIAFGLDPVSLSGAGDKAGQDADSFVDCLAELRARGFVGPLAELDGRFVHEAGGTEAQELAAVLASAVWWLKEWNREGRSPKDRFRFFGASLSADCDQFLSLAKFRAMRLLWARLCELCGEPTRLPIHAETSRRMMTRADPHTNLIRTTIAAFAAAVGGADSVTVLPFDVAVGPPDLSALALARNIQLILHHEADLARVADPAAGSGAVEAMTDALAGQAWAEFQRIENEGGILRSFASGSLQARIAQAREALRAALASGDAPLVGVTVYGELSDGAGSADPALRAAPPGELQAVSLEDLARRAA